MRRLLAITPPLSTPRLLQHVHALLDSAAPDLALMLRDPQATARTWMEISLPLRTLCGSYDVPVYVNRRVDIARTIGADGVHLRACGIGVGEARRLLPPGALVGASVHNEGEVQARQDADYLTISPFAATPGKSSPLSPTDFRRLALLARPKVYALGGVNPSNALAATQAGAWGLAFIRAGFPSSDASHLNENMHAFRAALDSVPISLG